MYHAWSITVSWSISVCCDAVHDLDSANHGLPGCLRERRTWMRPGRIVDLVVAARRARELLGHDGWTVDRLRAHQRARLDELVRYAVARSPFYRSLYGGGGS